MFRYLLCLIGTWFQALNLMVLSNRYHCTYSFQLGTMVHFTSQHSNGLRRYGAVCGEGDVIPKTFKVFLKMRSALAKSWPQFGKYFSKQRVFSWVPLHILRTSTPLTIPIVKYPWVSSFVKHCQEWLII